MGLFITRRIDPTPVQTEIARALMEAAPGTENDAMATARDRAAAAADRAAAGTVQFHAGRFLFALGLFLGLLGLAIAAEALDWVSDPGRIYDFATTVLGVIVGFLGGEATSSSTVARG